MAETGNWYAADVATFGDGLSTPDAPAALAPAAEQALGELQRLRAQVSALAEELGQLEKRLRHLMRQEA